MILFVVVAALLLALVASGLGGGKPRL